MSNVATAPVQYLTFVVGPELLAVPILRVREILEFSRPTKVPGTPGCIRGVINVRGAILPVVDLATKLGLEAPPPGRRSCIVVVEPRWTEEMTVLGIVVDEVLDVVELGPADVEPPPTFGSRIRLDFIVGIGKVGDSSARRLAVLLHVDKVLSIDELLAVEKLASTPPDQITIDVSDSQGQAR
jgi:purine-binding chemotaxis protein CheW